MVEAQDFLLTDSPMPGLERLEARFQGHAYDPHRHETYAIGLTLDGAQGFRYRGQPQVSRAGQIMVLHPDEQHDGHAAIPDGFSYRMIYVDPALISGALEGTNTLRRRSGDAGWRHGHADQRGLCRFPRQARSARG
jgi:hypothetical protein